MAIDGVDQTRAQAVLTLASNDSDAREHFIAAYTGSEDAIETLRHAADDALPAAPEAPSELPPITHAVSEQPFDADEPREAESTPGIRRWTLRPAVLACVVLGSMAIGAMAVALWTDAGGAPHSRPITAASLHPAVTNIVPGTDAIDGGTIKSTGPGSFTSAEEWFRKPAGDGDVFPSADLVDGLNAASTRLVDGTPKSLSLWVGETDDNRICLIMSVLSAQDKIESVASCANSQQFDAMGLGLYSSGYQAVWTGPTISVFSELTPRSD